MSDLTIIISDPKTQGSTGSKVTTWQLETGPKGDAIAHTVRRRYKDFAWLRDYMQKKYVGMFVPTLPVKPKTRPANERMLACFLEQLGESEYLKDDAATLAFLSASDSDWVDLTKTLTPTPSGAWIKTTDAASREYHQANAFAEYKGKLVQHEKKLLKLLSTVKGLVKASKSMSSALTKCGTEASSFGGSEGESDSVKQSLTNLGLAFTAWGKKSSLGPAVLYYVLRTSIEYQCQQVKGMKACLDAREASHVALEKAKKTLASAETQKASGAETTKGSMFAKYTSRAPQPKPLGDVIAEARAKVDELTETIKIQTGALHGREIAKFDGERDAAFTKVVGMVVVAMLKVQDDVTAAFNEHGAESMANAEGLVVHIKKSIKNYDTYGDDAAEDGGLGEDDEAE